MSTAVICDRCGKVVARNSAIRIDCLYIGHEKVKPIYGGDLCYECAKLAQYYKDVLALKATVPPVDSEGASDGEE